MLLRDHEERNDDLDIAMTLLSHPCEPCSELFKNKNSESAFNVLIYDTWIKNKYVPNVIQK